MSENSESMPDQEWVSGFVWGFQSTFESITRQDLVEKAADKLIEQGTVDDVEEAREIVQKGIKDLEEKDKIKIDKSGHAET